jgi:small subunit ribosomal protein S16
VAVRLRLKRFGRRHRPFYRLTVMDQRQTRDGRAIEELGYYDPLARTAEKQVSLKRERIEYWLSVGAKPSDTVRDLLKKNGIGARGSSSRP